MTFKDALAIFRERLKGDVNLKPRSKDYREERADQTQDSFVMVTATYGGQTESDLIAIEAGCVIRCQNPLF